MVTESDARGEALDRLGALVKQRLMQGTLRVAIDGIDAAGKTTLADELAELLDRADCQVLRASIDGFHHPASVRGRSRGLETGARYTWTDEGWSSQ